jgi:Domain of unknown function (DUF4388)
VSLEGTLETIALPDVLALLSVTAKTGELRIEAGGRVGSVWFDTGRLAGYEVGNHKTAVDALFALLRLREGHFKFYTGTEPMNAAASPQDVSPVLEEAENRLMQWPGIAAVVPSLYCELKLQDSVDGTVMLRPDQWQLVVTVGGGRLVADVLNVRGLGEYDGCKAVKELVDMRLVGVSEGEVPQQPEDSLGELLPRTADLSEVRVAADDQAHWHEAPPPAEEGAQEAVAEVAQVAPVAEVPDLSAAVWNDETGEAEGGVEVAGEAEVVPAPGEPVNRGLLLKFLGSARN